MSDEIRELQLFDGKCPKCGAKLTEATYDVNSTGDWLRCHCGRCAWDGNQRCLDAEPSTVKGVQEAFEAADRTRMWAGWAHKYTVGNKEWRALHKAMLEMPDDDPTRDALVAAAVAFDLAVRAPKYSEGNEWRTEYLAERAVAQSRFHGAAQAYNGAHRESV